MIDHSEAVVVKVRDAWKRYSPKTVILKGLNMTVEEGSIYGLLGPSGCGKTSLLNCIVGVKRLDSGTIDIAASKRIEVGFMPQEITLNNEFTIAEVFKFYGTLYGLSIQQIKERGDELVQFLELPKDDRFIGNCSGGQQRRISMAVSLLHDPKILILDEPTVGVDPVLCANIWERFLDLVNNKGKTIIITTHYIEEAKNANKIGLMRGGILLAEEQPQELMRIHNKDTLEAVFLKLSGKQAIDEKEPNGYYPPKKPNDPPLKDEKMFDFYRYKAQMVKNMIWTRRNLPITNFVICFPAVLFFLLGQLNSSSDGEYPISLKPLALVNDETSICRSNFSDFLVLHKKCRPTRPFSCRYIAVLKDTFPTVDYDTVEEAKQAITRGKAFGVLYFPSNFSAHMMVRIREQMAASRGAIIGSEVATWLDMSEFGLGVKTVQDLGTKMIDLLQDVCYECGSERKIASIPISIEEKFYNVENIIDTFVPPYFASVSFYTTFMFTSSAVLMERTSGLLERSKIAGLTSVEIVVSQVVIQVIVMILQNTFSFIVLYGIMNNPMRGNMGVAWLLISLTQISGMNFGFLMATILNEEKLVTYVGIATVLTLFMMTGTAWPMEGMHWALKPMSKLIPVKYTSQGYVDVAIKGYSLTSSTVLIGIIAPTVSIVVLIAVTVGVLKTGIGSLD